MTFKDKLNEYIEMLDITYTRLAKTAGLSISAVSHYVKGEREPGYDSEQMEKIIKGLSVLAEEKGFEITGEDIRRSLQDTVHNGLNVDYEIYLTNLNALLKMLDIKGSSLAKALVYDPSHISKILSGQRRPGDISKFTSQIATYIAGHYTKEQHISAIAKITGCEKETLQDMSTMRDIIITWLGSNSHTENSDPIKHFLEKMDSFNLDDFIQSIHFNDIKLPTAPFQLPSTRTYTGIQEMMESELDFMKATILSKSMEDCILYSDMPLEEMACDPEFPKKWMFGRAMMLKKGLHLNIIHDVNRPFHEMMLGLEGNMPMYMTGQISPYYLPTPQNGVFTHLLNVSGAAALEGHSIAGHQGSGRYMLFKSKEDVKHYRTRAKQLLAKSKPLMDIYRSDRKEEYTTYLRTLWQSDNRHTVCSSLPIYTISEELLDHILKRNDIVGEDTQQIRTFRTDYLEMVKSLLEKCEVRLDIPQLTRKQFEESSLNLSLHDLFFEKDIPYTYEEYTEHMKQTLAFAVDRPNLTIKTDPSPTFRNITYSIIGNKQVIVSKNMCPTIHFVIHHPKMVQAFRNFVPPIREGEA